jgi:hypothetical protein
VAGVSSGVTSGVAFGVAFRPALLQVGDLSYTVHRIPSSSPARPQLQPQHPVFTCYVLGLHIAMQTMV